MEFFTEMGKAITFEKFEPQLFLEDNNNIAVKGFFSGKANESGKSFESSWVMWWEVKAGKVSSYESFFDTAKSAEALK